MGVGVWNTLGSRCTKSLVHWDVLRYSQLSLSRLRLSRITVYLEEKIWSLLLLRYLKSGYKILRKRGEIAPGEQFLTFSTIFQYFSDN